MKCSFTIMATLLMHWKTKSSIKAFIMIWNFRNKNVKNQQNNKKEIDSIIAIEEPYFE